MKILAIDADGEMLVETNNPFLIELCRPIDWKGSYDCLEAAHKVSSEYALSIGRPDLIVPFKRPDWAK